MSKVACEARRVQATKDVHHLAVEIVLVLDASDADAELLLHDIEDVLNGIEDVLNGSVTGTVRRTGKVLMTRGQNGVCNHRRAVCTKIVP